jgi:hypothetical protein
MIAPMTVERLRLDRGPSGDLTSGAGSSPNLRRIVVDLQDEYARHVGHADLMREAIDGLVGDCPLSRPGELCE